MTLASELDGVLCSRSVLGGYRAAVIFRPRMLAHYTQVLIGNATRPEDLHGYTRELGVNTLIGAAYNRREDTRRFIWASLDPPL